MKAELAEEPEVVEAPVGEVEGNVLAKADTHVMMPDPAERGVLSVKGMHLFCHVKI